MLLSGDWSNLQEEEEETSLKRGVEHWPHVAIKRVDCWKLIDRLKNQEEKSGTNGQSSPILLGP